MNKFDVIDPFENKKDYIKKQFVPYGVGLALKKLDFKKECLAVYPGDTEIKFDLLNQSRFINDKSSWVAAPLWQQVIDWLWDNHQILVYPYLVPDKTKTIMWVSKQQYEDFWSTKEQAILKAIELCKKEE